MRMRDLFFGSKEPETDKMYKDGVRMIQQGRYSEAISIFSLPILRGHPSAIQNLALLHKMAYTEYLDIERTIELFRQSAEFKHPTGKLNYDFFVRCGSGTILSPQENMQLLDDCDGKQPSALLIYGTAMQLALGLGEKDNVRAFVLAELDAAQSGSDEVKFFISNMNIEKSRYNGKFGDLIQGTMPDMANDALNRLTSQMVSRGFSPMLFSYSRCCIIGHLMRTFNFTRWALPGYVRFQSMTPN